uniref:Bone Gla protein n=1 Tax=Mola mola TaxID=94237 RepID=A0A3Q3WQ41_MOLML
FCECNLMYLHSKIFIIKCVKSVFNVHVMQVYLWRGLASTVVRQKTASGQLSLSQFEGLRVVCEANLACEEMMDMQGIIAAYTAYYGTITY